MFILTSFVECETKTATPQSIFCLFNSGEMTHRQETHEPKIGTINTEVNETISVNVGTKRTDRKKNTYIRQINVVLAVTRL